MMSSMASISSASSATVRVEKATSEFLIGPDWTMNIDICDTINSNQMLAKDVVKAAKKRLQHKNPKVQLLALTLLESMVKNCGDYVHFQVAESNILQEMVKIVKKKTDMHVRDKILSLIVSWQEAFGGSGGRYHQYYMAYEDLRRTGVEFPRRSPDAAPIFTPPITHPIPRYSQPGYGMPSSSSTRLDEAMAAEENLSSSTINSMREVLDLLIDMLQAIDPTDRSAVKDEVIVDLVEQCRANQRKLMQMLTTTGDEELLGHGLELNDSLQGTLAKHNALASGSPLPPNVVINVEIGTPQKHDSSLQLAEADAPNATSISNPSISVLPGHKEQIAEEEEEEDDFAMLARRHLKTSNDTPKINGEGLALAKTTRDVASLDAPLSPVSSTALVPITTPAPVQTKDQDITDLMNINLSAAPTLTVQNSHTNTSLMPRGHMALDSPAISFSSEAYPGVAFNSYVAPWAHPQLRFHIRPELLAPQDVQKPRQQPPSVQPLPGPQPQFPAMYSRYPPPPWASTPGYFSNPDPLFTPRPTSSHIHRPLHQESINGDTLIKATPSPRVAAPNAGQKPFIPSYRLFEDLNVFGNADGGFKATTSHSSPSVSGSNNHSMV